MSNKTDLQTLNSEYSALIDTLKNKAAGGSVSTCSLTINPNTTIDCLYMIVNSAGHIVSVMSSSVSSTILIENLVCGSYVICQTSSLPIGLASDDANVTRMMTWVSNGIVRAGVYKITASAGESVVLDLT